MKSLSCSLLPVTAGLIACATLSHAELLVSDSFLVTPTGDDAGGVYEQGGIAGQSPDTLGFDPESKWSGAGKGLVNRVDGEGLTFDGYNAAGGSFLSKVMDRKVYQTTRDTKGELGADASQLFFAFLVNRTTTAGPGKVGVNFGRTGSGASESGPLEIGIAGTEYDVLVSSPSGPRTETTSGAGYSAGDTALLVLQVDVSSEDSDDDKWFLYVNPDLSAAPDTGAAALSGTGQLWARDTSLGAVQPRASKAEEPLGDWRIDEVRIATDFESLAKPE